MSIFNQILRIFNLDHKHLWKQRGNFNQIYPFICTAHNPRLLDTQFHPIAQIKIIGIHNSLEDDLPWATIPINYSHSLEHKNFYGFYDMPNERYEILGIVQPEMSTKMYDLITIVQKELCRRADIKYRDVL